MSRPQFLNEQMKILVTGGCGFIGTNLVKRLTDKGVIVKVLDNLTFGHALYFTDTTAEIIEGDVQDPQVVQAAMKGVDAVVHLAAYGSVVDSVAKPEANFFNNVQGTFSVLNAARQARVFKVVFASTGGALIGNAEPPVDEESLPKPISPYGASKLCGEAYCHAFGCAYGIETIALRFANVYGPFSAHKKGAVTTFMKALMKGEPMVIYGDGTASRDFLYVQDLCEGIELSLTADMAPGSVLHLASGVEVPIGFLAKTIADVCGQPDHPIEYRPSRPGEVGRNFARFEKARQLLGFKPAKPLEEGLKLTWEWFQKQGQSELTVAATPT